MVYKKCFMCFLGGSGKAETFFFSQKKSPPKLNISYGNNSLRHSLISKATFSNALLQDCPVILVYNNTLIIDKQGGTLSWVRPWKLNQKLLQKVHILFLEAPARFRKTNWPPVERRVPISSSFPYLNTEKE